MGSPRLRGRQGLFLEKNPNVGSCSERQRMQDRQQKQLCPPEAFAEDRLELAEVQARPSPPAPGRGLHWGTCACPHLYLPTPLLWGSRGAGPLSCPLPVLLHEDQSSGGTSLQEVLLTLWFLRPREHFRNKQAPGQRGAAGSLVAP